MVYNSIKRKRRKKKTHAESKVDSGTESLEHVPPVEVELLKLKRLRKGATSRKKKKLKSFKKTWQFIKRTIHTTSKLMVLKTSLVLQNV